MVSELGSLPALSPGFNISHSFSDKLERNTYLAWKAQFQAILAIHDLSHIINPTSPIPDMQLENGNPNPDFLAWKKVDTLVLSWIRATSSSSIQPMIFPCTTAIEAWSLLEKRLSPNSRVHIKLLREKLRNLKKETSVSMIDYLLQAKALADELAATGNSISESELIEFVTDGLGPEYRGLVSALALQTSTSFDDLFDILLHEESLLDKHSTSSPATSFSTNLHPKQFKTNNYFGRNNRGRWRPRAPFHNFCQTPYNSHLPPLLPTPSLYSLTRSLSNM